MINWILILMSKKCKVSFSLSSLSFGAKFPSDGVFTVKRPLLVSCVETRPLKMSESSSQDLKIAALGEVVRLRAKLGRR